MHVIDAIDAVHEIVYKPGWTFEASDHTGRYYGTVKVDVAYSAPNSAQEDAPDGYPNLINPTASFTVCVDDLPDRDALWLRIFDDVIREIEMHEAREFFRIRCENYRAPFHPHIPAGTAAYPGATRDGDVRFGIA